MLVEEGEHEATVLRLREQGAPLRGRMGTLPAHRITETRAGPKFPQRAKRAEGPVHKARLM